MPTVTEEDVAKFNACMLTKDGVAAFPADTVYGLACNPNEADAVQRMYRIKHRDRDQPSAIMCFDVDRALEALPDLGPRTEEAIHELLPGAVTLVLLNPNQRYPLACGDDLGVIGLRVPALTYETEAMAEIWHPFLQSSANLSGEFPPRRIDDIEPTILDAVDVFLDAGVLPGAASTVVDLTGYEDEHFWKIMRHGAVPREEIEAALG